MCGGMFDWLPCCIIMWGGGGMAALLPAVAQPAVAQSTVAQQPVALAALRELGVRRAAAWARAERGT